MAAPISAMIANVLIMKILQSLNPLVLRNFTQILTILTNN